MDRRVPFSAILPGGSLVYLCFHARRTLNFDKVTFWKVFNKLVLGEHKSNNGFCQEGNLPSCIMSNIMPVLPCVTIISKRILAAIYINNCDECNISLSLC